MSIDPQDDILQDFLVESREILESVGEQLIALERRPHDRDLLNSIFRGFHTIKGGGGFLGLDELVEVCHTTEDIFNLLRQGDKSVSADLMDTVLQALDVVNAMFARLEAGEALQPASADLMSALRAHNVPDGDAVSPIADPPSDAKPKAEADPDGDISDQEFEALLDALAGDAAAPGRPEGGAGDDISDDEFGSLLDDLHGKGQGPAAPAPTAASKALADRSPAPVAASANASLAEEPADVNAKVRGETSVRVDTAKLDDIMNLVGELVLVRNRLTTLRGELGDERLGQAVGNLELVTSDLQSAVMKTRMQPIKKVFGRFPRVIRDLARSLHKEIELTTRGEDTDLDKNLVEALADPLVHLVRNAVDHGLEGPDERTRAGKRSTGRVTLSAEQEGDRILLCIADDGRGMDPEALRGKAVDKKLLDQESARRLDRNDCFNLIFMPGFSTKEEISDVSGRGVGMDVVKNRISQLNGTIDIDSHVGEGTTIRIRVPLTLAILPTLMVRIQGRKFALPMSVVQEIFELDKRRINTVDNRMTVMVRNKAMPLFFLERWLARIHAPATPVASIGAAGGEPREERPVVTVQLGHQTIGFVVDEVIGLEEVVIKPLGAMLHGLPGLAGSTITGDGRIALIIDIPSLIKQYGRNL